MTITELLDKFDRVTKSGSGWKARCPAHRDDNPSLSIHEGKAGGIVLCCHAGCATENILAAVSLKMSDISATNGKPASRIVAEYEYRDETGALVYQNVRFEPKDFRFRRPDGAGGWKWGIDGIRRVPYRLSEMLSAQSVLIVEGEKDADTAHQLGLVATNAKHWRPEFSEFLRGKEVAIIADADPPGRKTADEIAGLLVGKVSSLKSFELPGSKDLTDWVEAGGTREALEGFVQMQEEWKPAAEPKKPLIRVYTAVELAAAVAEQVEFLAYPHAVRGVVSALDGEPKGSGKTTYHMRGTRAMLRGELFLNHATQRAPVLLVTEENPRTLKEALRRADLEHERDLHIIPWTSLVGVPWSALTEFLEQKCRELSIGLLIVDTLYAIAGLRPEEENQAAPVDALVAPLRSLAESLKMAVHVTRHDRKSGGPVGQSGRGSNALTGAVDIVLQLRRPDGQHPSTVRQLDILSRLDLPNRLLIELQGHQYVSLGERADVKTASAEDVILKHAPTTPEAAELISQILERAGATNSKACKLALGRLLRQGDLQTVTRRHAGRERKAYFRRSEPEAERSSQNTRMF